jgi:predicted dehydrogenase
MDPTAAIIMKFLIIGLGGIGQRHVRNLRTCFGDTCEIIAYRVRRSSPILTDSLQIESVDGLEQRYGIRSFDSLDAALEERPIAALICNPTSLHMQVAIAAAESGCHLLIEKPVSHSLDQVALLSEIVRRNSLVCMIAYQLRFHPCLIAAQRILAEGAIGRPLACRAVVGEYLPGWHSYEDYRGMYASKRALGGGVVVTQIHELDLMFWFFGRPKRVVSIGGHLSDLEIDVEDVASTLLSYDGMVAHLHQDYLQRPPSRQFEIIGQRGKLQVDLVALTVQSYGASGEKLETRSFPMFKRNSMFEEELRCFVEAIQCGGKVPVTLADGLQSLEMALAIRRSIDTGGPIDMSKTI